MAFLDPKINLPTGHDYKDIEDIILSGKISRKKRTTIGELSSRPLREIVPIEDDSQHVYKDSEVIVNETEQSKKELEPISVDMDAVKKEDKIIETITTRDKKDFNPLDDKNIHIQKQDVSVSVKSDNHKVDQNVVLDENRPPKYETININGTTEFPKVDSAPDVEHTHISKIENEIDVHSYEFKVEEEITDPKDGEVKSETPIKDTTHEAKIEEEISDVLQTKKDEIDIFDPGNRDKKLEEPIGERKHEAKSEEIVTPTSDEKKDEVELENKYVESRKQFGVITAPVYSDDLITTNLNYDIDSIATPAKEFGLYEAPRYKDDLVTTNVTYTALDLINLDEKTEEEISNDSDRNRKFPYVDTESSFNDKNEDYNSTEEANDITQTSQPQEQKNFKTYTYEEVLQKILMNLVKKTEDDLSDDLADPNNTVNMTDGFQRKSKKVARTDRDESANGLPDNAVKREDESKENADILYGDSYERRRYITQMLTRYDLISLFTNEPTRTIVLKGLRDAESFGLNGNFIGDQVSRLMNQALEQIAKATDVGLFSGDPTADGMHAFDVSRKLGIQTLRLGYSRAQSALLMGQSVGEDEAMDPAAGKIAKSIEKVSKIVDGAGTVLNPASAIKKLGNQTENITSGFIDGVMNDSKINKSAGHIFSNMYNYVTTLSRYAQNANSPLAGASNVLKANTSNSGDELTDAELKNLRKKQRKLARQESNLKQSDKKLSTFLTEVLPPSEMVQATSSGFASRKDDTYYDIESDRSDTVPNEKLTWREYQITQKPRSEEDFDDNSYLNKRLKDRKYAASSSPSDYSFDGKPERQQQVKADNEEYLFRNYLFTERFNESSTINEVLKTDSDERKYFTTITTNKDLNELYDLPRGNDIIREKKKFEGENSISDDIHLKQIHGNNIRHPDSKEKFFEIASGLYKGKVFKAFTNDEKDDGISLVSDQLNVRQEHLTEYTSIEQNDQQLKLYNRSVENSDARYEYQRSLQSEQQYKDKEQQDPHLKETSKAVKHEGPKNNMFRVLSEDKNHYSIDVIDSDVDSENRTLLSIDRKTFASPDDSAKKIISNFTVISGTDKENLVYKNTFDNQYSITHKNRNGEDETISHPLIKDYAENEEYYSYGEMLAKEKKYENIISSDFNRESLIELTPKDADTVRSIVDFEQEENLIARRINELTFSTPSSITGEDDKDGKEITTTGWMVKDSTYKAYKEKYSDNSISLNPIKGQEDASVLNLFSNDKRGQTSSYDYNVSISYPMFEDTVNINEVNEDQSDAALASAKNKKSNAFPKLELLDEHGKPISGNEKMITAMRERTHAFANDHIAGQGKQPVRINRMWSKTKYHPDHKKYELDEGANEAVIIYEQGTDGKAQYSEEERLVTDNNNKRYSGTYNVKKENYIYRLNNKDSGSHRAKDNFDLGYIAVLKNSNSKEISATQDGAVFTIPFQFNPEVSGEDRGANWATQTAMGRTNEFYFWTNTNARGLQFRTTIAITSESEDSSDNNMAFPWAAQWTEDFMIDILNKYRSLVLPLSFDRDSGLPPTPPVISIVRGPAELRWTKQSNVKLARWIVTDVSIEAKHELGFTLKQMPRGYDINLTLKEVYDSWKDWQDGWSSITNQAYTVEESHY